MDLPTPPAQWRAMFRVVLDWEAFKDWLSNTAHLTHNDLHLLLGVGLVLVIGRVLRKPLGSWAPWLIVLALETLNETSDFTRYYVSGWKWKPDATLIDYALTMTPALAIILAARWTDRHQRPTAR